MINLHITAVPAEALFGLPWAYGRIGNLVAVAVNDQLTARRQQIAALRALTDTEYGELLEAVLVGVRRPIFLPEPQNVPAAHAVS